MTDARFNLNAGPMPTTKRNVDLDGPDFYPTPRWATIALLDNEKFEGNIWECACGDGSMSKVIEKSGYNVISSDLYDRGYGESGIDFVGTDMKCSNVITNPPFHSAEGFIKTALAVSERKFAFLLRLAFLESANRCNTIFLKTPPSRVWVFSERITFYMKNAVIAGSGTVAYAWYVWDKSHSESTELKWFKPGYKAKY